MQVLSSYLIIYSMYHMVEHTDLLSYIIGVSQLTVQA